MIGSHDTYTYLKCTNPILEKFSRMWRTQCATIDGQYRFGIRFFDIRVHNSHNRWQVCHGICNFDKYFNNLKDLCYYIETFYPEAIYRIVLEKGSLTDEHKFLQQSYNLNTAFPHLWRLDIKSHKKWNGEIVNNDEQLYENGYKWAKGFTWSEPDAYEIHGFLKLNNWYKINLKDEAKKINNDYEIFKNSLQTALLRKDRLYFLDYCTNVYE